ncbi:hypothetical protein BKA62DRAFT_676799 [Auriculariales sp. MPI-PUGE-AT-0066]|nr:hypothetical protein BKA62DRAFT_676799 [Auriculariales sp. MPI-PUGE-AT-0066]
MPFCRSCGDIVHGTKCGKCGGRPVGGIVKVHEQGSQTGIAATTSNDTRSRTIIATLLRHNQEIQPSISRPISTRLDPSVSAHIAASTSTSAPTLSPDRKPGLTLDVDTLPASAGVLPDPDGGSQLSKVYGSVLQPRSSLAHHACAHCATHFQPDATIFPDPSPSASAGLKTEGGFVANGGRVWHRACFSTSPAVDLLGRPTCATCFETHLKPAAAAAAPRMPITKPKTLKEEASPAIDELHSKLGISQPAREGTSSRSRSREASPGRLESPQRDRTSARLSSPLGSAPAPAPAHHEGHSNDNLETTPTKREGKHSAPSRSPSRSPLPFSWSTKDTAASTPATQLFSSSTSTSTSDAVSISPRQSVDLSDEARCSTCDRALFNIAGGGSHYAYGQAMFVKPPGVGPVHLECAPLEKVVPSTFAVRRGRAQSMVMDTSSFHYGQENESLEDLMSSISTESASSTNAGSGAGSGTLRGLKSPSMADVSLSGVAFRPSPSASASIALPPTGSSPGALSKASSSGLGRQTCAGCGAGVVPMERGVVAGPSGSRWHTACLVCGGRDSTPPPSDFRTVRTRTKSFGSSAPASAVVAKREREEGKVGCGKKLDSGARCDEQGTPYCRECWMSLQHRSPTMSPLSPTFTGSSNIWTRSGLTFGLTRQMTGSGMTGPAPVSLARQATEHGVERIICDGRRRRGRGWDFYQAPGVTHSLGTIRDKPGRVRPRPKSMYALPGRGMFLVQQMTGSTDAPGHD